MRGLPDECSYLGSSLTSSLLTPPWSARIEGHCAWRGSGGQSSMAVLQLPPETPPDIALNNNTTSFRLLDIGIASHQVSILPSRTLPSHTHLTDCGKPDHPRATPHCPDSTKAPTDCSTRPVTSLTHPLNFSGFYLTRVHSPTVLRSVSFEPEAIAPAPRSLFPRSVPSTAGTRS